MAKVPEISTKRVAISKANAQMVGIVAAASFVAVFCLVASNAVWGQNRYQAKVVTAKDRANRQMQANLEAYKNLAVSYEKFDAKDPNAIGGSKGGAGDRDGRNSKIILDALPSTYDFPALTASIEKIITTQNIKISSISGTDDQVAQGPKSSSPLPKPVEMPFSFSVTNANYAGIQELIKTLQRSIRPIQIDKMTIGGGGDAMTLTIEAHTYYQPAKNLDITKKVVK